MNLSERKSLTGPLLVMALLVFVAATLRFAQDFFVPLVLAGLLSFLLSPLVRKLERWHLGRIGGVLVTAALAFVLIGGLTIWSPVSSWTWQAHCRNTGAT